MLKKNYKKSNIIFITILIILYLLMGYFNYVIDPYKIFKKDCGTNFIRDRKDLIYTYLKINKNKKNKELLIIGCSEIGSTFVATFQLDFCNNIWLNQIGFKDYYYILYHYLKLHPETKNIVISLSYNAIVDAFYQDMPKYGSYKLSIKEIYSLFFSFSTIFDSLLYLEDRFFQKDKHVTDYIEYAPYNFNLLNCDKDTLDKLKDESIVYLDKIIDLLNQKNIEYKFIIVPYSMLYSSLLYKNNIYKSNIDEIKKHIVNKGYKIYNYNIFNKYTDINNINGSCLYYAVDHPSHIYGIKIYKTLYDTKNAEDNLYIVLDKNNIDEEIRKENENLKKYINEHSELINIYSNIIKSGIISKKTFKRKTKDIPENYMQELIYLDNKIKNLGNNYYE